MTKGVERRGRTGTRSGVPPADDSEILKLYEQGMSQVAIARDLKSRGLGPTTQQGVAFRLSQILDREQASKARLLPATWRVKVDHSAGWIYTAALAYAKWRQGQQLQSAELAKARSLEEKLNKMEAVLTYDREQGFQIRNRRPDDAGLLV